ncbi:MAG: AI-2E family transporter [Rhodobacteraceae bacterium]|nr:AI-2E family transporter [Paracoccaceae bacterium]
MALSANEQVRYWGIGLVLVLVAMWLLGNVLLPFITGMTIAYFLDPVADRLERAGASRAVATTLITLTAMLVILLLVIVLGPLLVKQTAAFVTALPDYVSQFQKFISTRFPEFFDETSAVRQGLGTLVEFIRSKGGELANAVLASAFTIVDVAIFIVVAPVVAFYMLLDWDRMVATIDNWVPRDHLETVRYLARQVDNVLAGFVRGQLTVCAILGTFYAVALMAVGLQFGIVVGLIAGLLTFIPYVGSIIGGALSIGLALFQFWDTPVWIAAVLAIFIAGQMIEGNFLTPKLVGRSVGLHPVWLMFALSAFGSFMGFTGMLIAVPVAACLGVFFRFGVGQYLDGRLYKGLAEEERADG